MTKELSPDGNSIVRDDGSEVVPYVYLDGDGLVVAKAYIPVGHKPFVPDEVDASRSFSVDSQTDLPSRLSDSLANLPDSVPHNPASTAKDNLENVAMDDKYNRPP